MGFETSPGERLARFAPGTTGDMPPLLAWLANTSARAPAARTPRERRVEELTRTARSYVRRRPLLCIACAAAGGFFIGVLCARR